MGSLTKGPEKTIWKPGGTVDWSVASAVSSIADMRHLPCLEEAFQIATVIDCCVIILLTENRRLHAQKEVICGTGGHVPLAPILLRSFFHVDTAGWSLGDGSTTEDCTACAMLYHDHRHKMSQTPQQQGSVSSGGALACPMSRTAHLLAMPGRLWKSAQGYRSSADTTTCADSAGQMRPQGAGSEGAVRDESSSYRVLGSTGAHITAYYWCSTI